MVKGQLYWRPIRGFEGLYEISNLGSVRSFHSRHRNKRVKERIDRAYYYTVRLSKNGKSYTKYVHRLLAENFLPNPFNKPHVNHINCLQLDNHLYNLEWVTHSENVSHAYREGSITKKTKQVVNIETGEEFPNYKAAARRNNLNANTLKNYLNGQVPNRTSLRYK